MAVLQVSYGFPGQVGVSPRQVLIKTTDSLDTITSVGYLNNLANYGYTFNPTDIIYATYNNNTQVQAFSLLLDNGLYVMLNEAYTVTLPVVDGHFAEFSGPYKIADSGISLSNASNTRVVMFDSPYPASIPTNRSVASFSDNNGTVVSKYMRSNPSVINYCMATTVPVAAGDFAVYSDITGSLGDMGYSPSTTNAQYIAMADTAEITDTQYVLFEDQYGTLLSTAVPPSSVIAWFGLNGSINSDGSSFFPIPFDVTYLANSQFTLSGGAIVFTNPGVYQFWISATTTIQAAQMYTSLRVQIYVNYNPISGPSVNVAHGRTSTYTASFGANQVEQITITGLVKVSAGDSISCNCNPGTNPSGAFVINPVINSSYIATNIIIKRIQDLSEE